MAASAILLYRQRFVYADGSIREMVLWKLPKPTPERRHGLKYRLFYRTADGRGVVRYDNEKGKGDHRHLGPVEHPYRFTNVEALVRDFLNDIERLKSGQR